MAFARRYVEGGGFLRGYAGMPLPAERFATWNFEAGPSISGDGLRLFGFYDRGRIWEMRGGSAKDRSDAGIGIAFLGSKSRLFGGNLALLSGLAMTVQFPIWLSHPPAGEQKFQFRWYFTFGKSL